MKFIVTETQTVVHTYTWEMEADSQEEALSSDVPTWAIETSRMISSDTEAKCTHDHLDVSDRSTFVCQDCDEELGR